MAETILAKLAVEVTAKATQFGKALGEQEKSLNKFQKSVSGASNLLKGAFATISIGLIGREIINITSEFQKFEAVLTNTLGSQSEAQRALVGIRDFAAKTPFSVQELTSSFVKLANQGFKPTTNELRKLGDLASSTGKGFDQLAEAIIDAQVGEFERLKEFGIRAQKQGDQVKFTFKGVQTQVAFTSAEIQKYVLSLGDVQGVSGSMAAISATLGGKISNLGDSFDNLLLTLGNLTSGPLIKAIDGLNELLGLMSVLAGGDPNPMASLQIGIRLLNEANLSAEQYAEALAEVEKKAEALGIPLIKLTDAATGLSKILIDPRTTIKVIDPVSGEIQAKTLQALQKELALLNTQFETTDINDKQSLVNTGLKIAAIRLQIEALEKLRKEQEAIDKLSSFGRKQLANAEAPDRFDNVGNRIGVELPEEKDRVSNRSVGEEFKLPPVEPPDFSKFQQAFEIIRKEYEKTGIIAYNYGEQARQANELDAESRMKAADAAAEYGSIVGDALGSALSGQQSFAQTMKKLTADLLKTFLARALGGIIASAATAGGPPPVAIALAAAGVAAISAMFAKIGGGGGGSVGGSLAKPQGSNVSRTSTLGKLEDRIIFEGTLVAKGNDLVYVMNNVNNKKGRTG